MFPCRSRHKPLCLVYTALEIDPGALCTLGKHADSGARSLGPFLVLLKQCPLESGLSSLWMCVPRSRVVAVGVVAVGVATRTA